MSNPSLLVIGITGRARAGKSLFATLLQEHIDFHSEYPYVNVHVISLADALKDECAEATGLNRDWFDDAVYKETLRPLMQWWGTEFRRNTLLGGYPEYWRDRLADKICQARMQGAGCHVDTVIVIVPDVRFDDEALLIRDYADHMMLEVLAPDAETTTHVQHSSEAGIDPALIEYTFTNMHSNGLAMMRDRVVAFYDERIEPYLRAHKS